MANGPDIQQLVQVPIFRGLTEAQVRTIAKVAGQSTAAPGDVLFQEGDAGDGLYVVLAGTVEIVKGDKAGQLQELARLGDGSVIGEMSLITGDAPRSATARAATQVTLLKLASQRFTELLAKDDVIALKIVHNLAQVLARRLHLMSEKVVDLSDRPKRKEELAEFQRILTNWSF